MVLLSFFLIFLPIQPGVAYKSVAYGRKRVIEFFSLNNAKWQILNKSKNWLKQQFLTKIKSALILLLAVFYSNQDDVSSTDLHHNAK